MKFLVYGTLRKDLGNSRIFKDGNAKWLGIFKTKPNFTMVSLGGFPAVEENGNTSITGEVWETDDQKVIDRVMMLEGCSGVKDDPRNWYNFTEIETDFGKAVMFTMNNASSTHEVKSGDWYEHIGLRKNN